MFNTQNYIYPFQNLSLGFILILFIRGLKCRPIEVEYLLKLSADKLPVSNDHRLKFIFSKDSYQIFCVYVTMAPHY